MREVLNFLMALVEFGRNARRRLPAAMLCMLLAALSATGVTICAVAALWIWLVPRVGPVAAPLIVAGAFLVLCLIFLWLGRRLLRPLRPRPRLDLDAVAAEAMTGQVTRLVRDHKVAAVLVALVVGLLAGNGRGRRSSQ